MIERSKMLKITNNSENLLLIAGKPKKVIDQMIDNRNFNEAILVAAALRDKNFQTRTN